MNFIENESRQKLRGGYYTPSDLATYIARWTLGARPKSVLEPSCGDGVFFRAAQKLPAAKSLQQVLGFEIEEAEAAKARQSAKRLHQAAEVRTEDFLAWAIKEIDRRTSVEAVLGNPPFIRYQYLDQEAQARAEVIFRMLHLPFTKHTNAWVPFVLAAIALLRPGGRLGMILPAEIVHVMHAQSLRTYLGRECSRLLIIDPEEIWFEDTLQGAVILFAEKKTDPAQHSQGLGIHKVSGRSFLGQDPETLFDSVTRINGKTVEGKWTRALLSKRELDLFDELMHREGVYRFDDIAEVNVGIVTGANKFFLVTDEVVKEYQLSKFAHPMFGRSEHCEGVIYDAAQHEKNAAKGNPTNFIWIPADAKLSKAARRYIEAGERENLHTRYKCRIRTPWYTVPSVHSTRIGMLKRSHETPRLIYNEISAFTTDTAYRITSSKWRPEVLVYCFLNSLTALSAELEGRHYGGGVLELVPSEIEKLVVPVPEGIEPKLSQLDKLVRTSSMDDVLSAQGRRVLGKLGVKTADQDALTSAWRRLKNRRHRVSTEDQAS